MIIETAKGLGWNTTETKTENGNTVFGFQRFSPAGQDFNIEVDWLDDEIWSLIDAVHKVYWDFDVSYETYLWLDNTGHGKRGAPDDMREVYNDMEACEESIHQLWKHISELDFDKEEYIERRDRIKDYIYDNFNVPNDNCTLAPSMLDGILDYAEELDEDERYNFLHKVLPFIPDNILESNFE